MTSPSAPSASGLIMFAMAVAGCAPAGAPANDRTTLPERYRYLQGVMVVDHDLPAVRSRLPYARIEFSQSSPWGFGGPTIVLERDGIASMSGTPPRTGKVSIFDFGHLCCLIERIGFETFEPRYAWGGFDATTFTLKVWRAPDAEPIVVEDYGGVGPPELWVLRTAIEGVASHIDWK